jgi:hypothetical protein
MKFSSYALLPAVVLASPVTQDVQQAPQQVTISSSRYSGSGCPQGSVSSIISPDKTTITFGFDSFQAQIGPNAPQTAQNKNCQLHLDLRYPSGFQLSLMTATYHGFVRLDDGVEASFISQYYFSQAAAKTVRSCSLLFSHSRPSINNVQGKLPRHSLWPRLRLRPHVHQGRRN